MAMDVYAPCPCGSGKKLKFCCQNIAEDMDRISRLIENHQSRQAVQQLEALERKVPGHAWVATTHAIVLLESGEAAAARDRLKSFVEQHPEHEFASVIYAAALFQSDGLETARPVIARAFQKGAKHHPAMVSGIAAAMASVLYSEDKLLAARAHQTLALRFSPDQQRQEIFMRLVEFDGDRSILYPLRGSHPLPTVDGGPEVAGEVRKAQKYAGVGCWDTSADIFEKLADQLPGAAEPWHAAGLCRAWFGDEAGAAKSLHRAAELYADPSPAVECETIAQILDWSTTPNSLRRMELLGNTSSVSRVLTAFDNHPRFVRSELPPPETSGMPPSTAMFRLVSIPQNEYPAVADLNQSNLPTVLANVYVVDANPEQQLPGRILLVGMNDSSFDQAAALAREVSGELVEWKEPAASGDTVPPEFAPFFTTCDYPEKTPLGLRRRLEVERWQNLVENSWKSRPQQALQGRTPLQAATIPELRVRLLAAVHVLDAVCLRGRYELNAQELLQSLSVEPLPPIAMTPDLSLNALNPLEWLRLPLNELTDEQLVAVTNRAQLIHHDRFLYETLKVALNRDGCVDQLDDVRAFQTLIDLCRDHLRRDEALEMLQRGRDRILGRNPNFEQQWYWDLHELSLRLEDPSDPALQQLTQKFVNYYTPKLPQMRSYLERVFELSGLPSPWQSGSLFVSESVSSGGALWTPESAEPAAAGSKLWVPG